MDHSQELKWSWQRAAALASQSQPIFIKTQRGMHRVPITHETRRLLHAAYHHAMKLRREKQTRERLHWYLENRIRKHDVWVRKRLERLHPKLRVRSKDNQHYEVLPKIVYTIDGKTQTVGGGVINAQIGRRQAMVDYTPHLYVNPPFRWNNLQAQRSWLTSTSCTMECRMWVNGKYHHITYPKGKWCARGLSAIPNTGGVIGTPITFDDDVAQDALQRAIAKIKDSDLNFGEYTVEALQVFRLLVDPLRTILRYHRVLDRWTRRNNWIWIPRRTYRRYHSGNSGYAVPVGDVLMSMRTKRELKVDDLDRGAHTLLNAAANRWLQYRYGIKPLISDITCILGGLAEREFGTEWLVKGARVWVRRTPKKYVDYDERLANGITSLKWRCNYESGLHYTAKQFYKLDRMPPLSYVLGVHPSQWLRVFWNATPWSFVADWWLNVDRALLAAVEMPGLKLGPNHVTAKAFDVGTAYLTRGVTTAASATPYVIKGNPLARKGMEKVNRKINIVYANRVLYSRAWLKLKNKLTLGALSLSKFKVRR